MTKRRVSEAAPVQVYLGREGQEQLERLTAQLDTTKSEILRRGLMALERELLDPRAHPALRLIGIASTELAGADADDAARDHDRLLADSEEAAWAPAAKRGTNPRGRRSRAR
jgi:hypothetical protein